MEVLLEKPLFYKGFLFFITRMVMKIRLLTEAAYNRIITLKETMSKKDRGYGVIPIKIQNITFAIPFRSNMTHKPPCVRIVVA
ncbi:hypothetical protein A8139_09860 [Marinomonas primoryensis]|uniref:Uncharacterized protein n=1 Tax=Marinomonas primoryensis TaxID=178399 RepID=A0A2Z4PRT8_9GAMM|nr:hypothetical protein A8139_09860 [Marinomonas primoryensis]